jgi:hypothetical protein
MHTVELKRGAHVPLRLLPTLFPERARAITEVRRATLHLRIEDLDGNPESHDTFSLVCLSHNSSFNTVTRPGTSQRVDLTQYYGAWVTPYVRAVQEFVGWAASRSEVGSIAGYQGGLERVEQQVKGLYEALKEFGVRYVNSVIDYGATLGHATQRTRLPRESLATKSANCIDGTVLMASLLEATSLESVLVLVPGHAFVGWRTWSDPGAEWRYLETTMTASHDFAAACASARQQYEQAKAKYKNSLRWHPVAELRRRGMYPME